MGIGTRWASSATFRAVTITVSQAPVAWVPAVCVPEGGGVCCPHTVVEIPHSTAAVPNRSLRISPPDSLAGCLLYTPPEKKCARHLWGVNCPQMADNSGWL